MLRRKLFTFSSLCCIVLSGSSSLLTEWTLLFWYRAAIFHENTLYLLRALSWALLHHLKVGTLLVYLPALGLLFAPLSYFQMHTVPKGRNSAFYQVSFPLWANLSCTMMHIFLNMLILPISQVCVSINFSLSSSNSDYLDLSRIKLRRLKWTQLIYNVKELNQPRTSRIHYVQCVIKITTIKNSSSVLYTVWVSKLYSLIYTERSSRLT